MIQIYSAVIEKIFQYTCILILHAKDEVSTKEMNSRFYKSFMILSK